MDAPPASPSAVTAVDDRAVVAPASDLAPAITGLDVRRRFMGWVAGLALLGLAVLIALHPGLRALAGDTWRELRSVRPVYVGLILALKVAQALCSALIWRNALLAAWPTAELSYRFVLGVDQGKDALNTVSPARAGTWAMFGLLDLSIPEARIPTLVAVWGVQSLAFGLFALINYALIAVGLPEQTRTSGGWRDRLSSFAASQPVATDGIALLLLLLLVLSVIFVRRRLGIIRQQVVDGLAILGTPGRYLRLIFLPSLAAYAARCAANAALLVAFGIPVTVWTVALVLGSRAAAGAVRITLGGVGTTQALEVVALRNYAAAEAITAYSLADLALSAVVSFGIAIPALLSYSGWRGTRALISNPASASSVSFAE
jgi:hypothetical protein